MSSSISSSSGAGSRSRLVVLLLTTVALLGAYSAWFERGAPDITHHSNQWIENQAVAERYVYLDSDPDVVIVGSSLAARLIPEYLDERVYNLSFAGSSAATGLAIIRESGRLPNIVLVETNTIELPLDQELIDRLFVPGVRDAKRTLTFLQKDHQPASVLNSWVMQRFATSLDAKERQPIDRQRLSDELARKLELNTGRVDDMRTVELGTVESLVEYLDNAGVEIILFDMPVHPDIAESPVYRERAARLAKRFPHLEHWRADGRPSIDYQTTDGTHLAPAAARAFGTVLSDRLP